MQNEPPPQQVAPLTKQTLPGPHSALVVHGWPVHIGVMHADAPSVFCTQRQPPEPHAVKLSQVHGATHWFVAGLHTWPDGQQIEPVGVWQMRLISPPHWRHACKHEACAGPEVKAVFPHKTAQSLGAAEAFLHPCWPAKVPVRPAPTPRR